MRLWLNVNFKLGIRMEDDDPQQPQAHYPPRSKIKVARSRDQSEPSWPNAVYSVIRGRRGILTWPNQAATHLVSSLKFVGLAVRKIWRTMYVSINGPGDLTFDLKTGMRVASKVGNLSSKFGHARSLGIVIRYVPDGRTDRRTKATLYCPLPYGRRHNTSPVLLSPKGKVATKPQWWDTVHHDRTDRCVLYYQTAAIFTQSVNIQIDTSILLNKSWNTLPTQICFTCMYDVFVLSMSTLLSGKKLQKATTVFTYQLWSQIIHINKYKRCLMFTW